MLILGNCLNKLKDIANESVDLVYLDPPFFTQKTHSLTTRDGSTTYEFEDSWESIVSYLSFIKACLTECRRVLRNTGSVFLHCDKSASHHLRLVLDEVFEPGNFQSEIVWAYRRWSNSKKGLLNAHQTIFFYSKSEFFKFNTLFTDYSATTNIDQILQERVRNQSGKTQYNRDEFGNLIMSGEKRGVPLSDVWNIPYLNPKAAERTGYPTQKPILLLEQIIKISTNEGDTVLDPFCGSGTTLVAARLLDRLFIGIDKSAQALELSRERLTQLVKTRSFLLEKGEASYRQKNEWETLLLNSLGAVPVQRNKGIDGFLWLDELTRPIAIKIQKPNESLEDAKRKLITAISTKNCEWSILVRTNPLVENSLFELSQPEMSGLNLLVMDCYDLTIRSWLSKFEEKPGIKVG